MAVSGKTAAPWEVPYFLGTDKPPDMAAGTKAIADRTHAVLPSGAFADGKIIVCESGAMAFKAMSGDATIAADGTVTIGAEKVTAGMLKALAVEEGKIKDAAVTDAKLASPNNSVYRNASTAQGNANSGIEASTYAFAGSTLVKSGAEFSAATIAMFYFDDADYLAAGKTLKMRMRVQLAPNATKPTIKFTVGLYPVSSVAGGANKVTLNLGTVVAGSTLEFNEPAASTLAQNATADFAIPADGYYIPGVVLSGALTASNMTLLSAQVQVRNV